jgi:hypothetical protein
LCSGFSTKILVFLIVPMRAVLSTILDSM